MVFGHKTGLTFNYGSNAGIVRSLPGEPPRRYVISFISSLGYRYTDPPFASRSTLPVLRRGGRHLLHPADPGDGQAARRLHQVDAVAAASDRPPMPDGKNGRDDREPRGRRASREREERGGGRRRKGGRGRGTGDRGGQARLAGRPLPGAIRADGETGVPDGGIDQRGRGPGAGRLRPHAPPLGQRRAPEGLPAHGRGQRLPVAPAPAGPGAGLPSATRRPSTDTGAPGRGRRAVRRPGRPARPASGRRWCCASTRTCPRPTSPSPSAAGRAR